MWIQIIQYVSYKLTDTLQNKIISFSKSHLFTILLFTYTIVIMWSPGTSRPGHGDSDVTRSYILSKKKNRYSSFAT